nr:uncharacterized protein LOC110547459 [Meriones unguiculatus]
MKQKCTLSRLTGIIDEEGCWIRESESTQYQLATPRPKSGVSDMALRCPLLLHLVQPRDKTTCHFLEEQEEKKLWRQIPVQLETKMLRLRGSRDRQGTCCRKPRENWTGDTLTQVVEVPTVTACHGHQHLGCPSKTHTKWQIAQQNLTLQNLALGPKMLEGQHVSQSYQKKPEKMAG